MQDKLGQTLGAIVNNWTGVKMPERINLLGQYCKLEALNIDAHGAALFDVFSQDKEYKNWTYLPYGPFESVESYKLWLKNTSNGSDLIFYVVVNQKNGEVLGIVSYLSINPKHGVIEIGHVHFSSKLQKTPIATEAIFLMIQYVFDEAGYRRCEWKCNALNESSKNAALRFGFSFEGVFRQALVVKGRNRDTAWYSILDSEWPEIRKAFILWLQPENFDKAGKQKVNLKSFRK